MKEYRAYFVGTDGHFTGFEPLICRDDGEAIAGLKASLMVMTSSFGMPTASLYGSFKGPSNGTLCALDTDIAPVNKHCREPDIAIIVRRIIDPFPGFYR